MAYYNTTIEKFQGKLPKKYSYKYCKMVRQNNVIDVTKMTWEPECHIKRLTKKIFINTKTGEVKEVMPKVEGVQFRNIRSLKMIFKNLRQLITTNFEGADNEFFVTLTYREQTNDPKQVLKDLNVYNMRLKRAYPGIGYIHIVEPHASGNYHIHSLIKRVDGEPLNMTYDDIYKLWGQGYVTVKHLNNVDNIGAYFIAYFSNVEVSDEDLYKYPNDIKERAGKKYIKGIRLDYYPDYMKIYRNSKNLKQPELTDEIPDSFTQTYEAGYKLTSTDEDGNTSESYVKKEQHRERGS